MNPLSLEKYKPGLQIITLFCFSLVTIATMAGGIRYPVDSIPKMLLENASVVLRTKNVHFNVHSSGRAEMDVTFAVTILKENANTSAMLLIGKNKFTRIRQMTGAVYNSHGERVEKLGLDDFYDFSSIADFSIYEDNRVVACRPEYMTVPFTAEYSYHVEFFGIMDYPDFALMEQFNVSVQKANLLVTAPDSIGIRYLLLNSTVPCRQETRDEITQYAWSFSHVPAIRNEPFSPPVSELTPVVLLAPKSIKLEKYRGVVDSWSSLGRWVNDLNRDRDNLPEATTEKVRGLTEKATRNIEKIDILYHYLQEKTRYVSIQIGIGGWQPIPASEVDLLGYGDCKALTNYMKALLHAVGIESYYTLVKAGIELPDIHTDFPSPQFNHAILCVPVESDTVWLECTSQDHPTGYLGAFTSNRHVLVITGNGGVLCRTPIADEKQNIRRLSGNLILDKNGDARAELTFVNHGIFYDTISPILRMDQTDIKTSITSRLRCKNFQLEAFDIKEDSVIPPSLEESLALTSRGLITRTATTHLIQPNQFSPGPKAPSQMIKRKNPVWISWSSRQTDTLVYELPEGIKATGEQINDNIVTSFGTYRSQSQVTGSTIRYTREFTLRQGSYPSEQYEELLGFLEKVARSDSKKIALTGDE